MRGRDVRLAVAFVAAMLIVRRADADANEVPGVVRTPAVEDRLPGPSLRVLTLDEALSEARAKNPGMRLAKNQALRASALVEQARAGALPTIGANAVFTRLDDDRILGGRLLSAGSQQSANVALVVPLVVPRAWAQWAHAVEASGVAEANVKDAERQLLVGVARTYLAVVGQQRLVEVARRARDSALVHEAYAATRLEGGVGNRLDATRAHQERSSADVVLANTEQALDRMREALGVLVGAEGPVDAAPDDRLDALPPQFPHAQAAASPAAAAETNLAKRRADLVALDRARALAESVVRRAWLDYLPSVGASFTPFFQNPATAVQPQFGWQAQLVLGVPLYDGGARSGAHAEREVLASDAELRLEQATAQASAELRTAGKAMVAAQRTLDAAREAARFAREALELASDAYRAGATRSLEVVDAERRARDADTQVAVAEDGLRQARLDWLVAAGTFP